MQKQTRKNQREISILDYILGDKVQIVALFVDTLNFLSAVEGDTHKCRTWPRDESNRDHMQ